MYLLLILDELNNTRTEMETQAQSTANFKGMSTEAVSLLNSIMIIHYLEMIS